jgi:hemoglobin
VYIAPMRMGRVIFVAAILASFSSAIFACGPSKKPPPKEPAHTETIADAGVEEEAAPPPKPLIERLGKKEGLTKVVDTLMKNVAADAKINKRFAKLKGKALDDFKAKIVDFICHDLEGGCEYAGKNMKDAHKGMKIKEDEWNAFLGDLKAALDENNVSGEDQADLMARLGPLHDDIVEAKPPAKK